MARTWIRRWGAVAASVALGTTALVAGTAAPAAADTNGDALFFASPTSDQLVVVAGTRRTALTTFPTAQVLAGHFTQDTGAQAFLYNPGSGPDALVDVIAEGGGLQAQLSPTTVNGTYRPFVADLDGNGRDDIVWYAPGRASDHIWFFGTDGTVESVEVTITGDFRPLPIHLDAATGPGRTAVLWYAPGPANDALWVFDGTSHSSRRLRIDGRYQTVAAPLRAPKAGTSDQQVLFADTEHGTGWLWTFPTGKVEPRSERVTVPRGRIPVAHDPAIGVEWEGVFWYGPGPASELFQSFASDGKPHVGGTQISATQRVLRDPTGHSAAQEIVLLGSGTTARSIMLGAEGAPTLGTVTPIPNVPAAPIAARTTFLIPPG